MGLDMYLHAKKYVSGYQFARAEDRELFQTLIATSGAASFVDPETPSASVSFTAAYWRKANQIHAWFVEHVQDGKDDCGSYYVSREQLQELRDLCSRVLASTELVDGEIHNGDTFTAGGELTPVIEAGRVVGEPALAQELLPTQQGFFFGGTDYDEWYWHDLEQTVAQIDRALAAPGDWTFEYHASW